jgi:hypothetical protein
MRDVNRLCSYYVLDSRRPLWDIFQGATRMNRLALRQERALGSAIGSI